MSDFERNYVDQLVRTNKIDKAEDYEQYKQRPKVVDPHQAIYEDLRYEFISSDGRSVSNS